MINQPVEKIFIINIENDYYLSYALTNKFNLHSEAFYSMFVKLLHCPKMN